MVVSGEKPQKSQVSVRYKFIDSTGTILSTRLPAVLRNTHDIVMFGLLLFGGILGGVLLL